MFISRAFKSSFYSISISFIRLSQICFWVNRCRRSAFGWTVPKIIWSPIWIFYGLSGWIIGHRMKNISLRIKILALEIFLAQSTQNAPNCFIFSDKKIIPKYLIFFMQMTLKIIFRALSYFHLMSSLWVCFLCFFLSFHVIYF